MKPSRCLSQYHNRFGPQYDGRLEILDEGRFCRLERCKVCGREYITQYANNEETVKIEIEDWQTQAIEKYNARVQARQPD